MPLIPLKPFYFLRHGETDWNKKRLYMGQQDIPLNETGVLQAQEASKVLEHEPIRHIAVSPLRRAYETAQIINKKLKVPLTVLEELKEVNLGAVEGQAHGDGAIIQKWLNDEHPKDSEPRLEFEKRVISGINKAIKLSENVLIVSHGGVYAALLRSMQWPAINMLGNCELISHKPPKLAEHLWGIDILIQKEVPK